MENSTGLNLKLSHVVGLQRSRATSTKNLLTAIYHSFQKLDLVKGLLRTWAPKSDDGEKKPPEQKHIQTDVQAELEKAKIALRDLLDVTATRDKTNTLAKADVILNGKVIMENVPAVHLLTLEQTLTDIITLIGKIPTLDTTERWTYQPNKSYFETEPVVSAGKQKMPVPIVLSAATDKHQAQVQLRDEEVIMGYWTTIHSSSARPKDEVAKYMKKALDLREAVQLARKTANETPVQEFKTGDAVINHIFG